MTGVGDNVTGVPSSAFGSMWCFSIIRFYDFDAPMFT